mmetsp:Transcript_7417/g.21914  ORF Transcript_7417/g.21914 Transcript_7417/m.21914 type:complete len:289 (+) Transcript_7417:202-1068(+)
MGYEESPWIFKGRALFQLQLVKVSEARKYVPEGLKLVNFFGYTLGGFFLSRYTDSPVGEFDELVAMAGLVWNFPGSCAWAARVYVNDKTARDHGLHKVGLPSRQASFEQDTDVTLHHRRGWWTGPEAVVQAAGSGSRSAVDVPAAPLLRDHPLVVRNGEGGRRWQRAHAARGLPGSGTVARFTLPAAPSGWPGPRLTINLPSFSGGTEDCPEILKYTCKLATNCSVTRCTTLEVGEGDSLEALAPILRGRPLICFNFADMEMSVKEPVIVPQKSRGKRRSGVQRPLTS